MLRSTYDTNADGKVNAADVADAVPWSGVTGKPATFAPSTHTHTAANISDSTAVGRAVLTAVDAAAARAAIGAGTSSTTGTVTDVTGTAPITSTGGTAPAIGIEPATTFAAGSMSAADKIKLDGVASGATNYTHPASHPPSIITQDASNRFVTDAEKATWNAKGDVTLTGVQTLTNKTLTGLREIRTALGANNIDLSTGNFFTKTISGATTFTVSNVPASGTSASFILDLTNGGSAAITWWSGVKWAGGTAPTLTSSERDVLGFFTHDGGTTWTGLVLGKDVK